MKCNRGRAELHSSTGCGNKSNLAQGLPSNRGIQWRIYSPSEGIDALSRKVREEFQFVPCCRDEVAGDSSGIEQAECWNSQMGVGLN